MLFRVLCVMLCLAVVGLAVGGWGPRRATTGLEAAESTRGEVMRLGKFNSQNETVDFFSAIEQGQIRVRLIPRNARKARLLIDNQTEQPLNVRFPAAFAAVPVLAQWQNWQPGGQGQFGQQGQLGQGNNMPGKTQQIGGSFPGPMNQIGNGPFMNIGNQNAQPGQPGQPGKPWQQGFGPIFNVAPEMVGQMKLTTVCLEHGKPDPKPKAKYEIRPVERVSDKPAVAELLRLMSASGVSQRAAQVAAWHLNNGKSWKELTAMKKSKLLPVDPVFSKQELAAGRRLVEAANAAVEESAERKKQDKSLKTSASTHSVVQSNLVRKTE